MMDAAALAAFLQGAQRDIFRLETLPAYEVASDGGDFAAYLAGEPGPDPERKRPTLEWIAGDVARGVTRRRVHVLRQPLSDYLRYECEWGYAPNAAAGEDIRILDLSEMLYPLPMAHWHVDFWVVDGHDAALMNYADDGRFKGAVIDRMPAAQAIYHAVHDACWDAAEPFAPWWARHPQYHRDRKAA